MLRRNFSTRFCFSYARAQAARKDFHQVEVEINPDTFFLPGLAYLGRISSSAHPLQQQILLAFLPAYIQIQRAASKQVSLTSAGTISCPLFGRRRARLADLNVWRGEIEFLDQVTDGSSRSP